MNNPFNKPFSRIETPKQRLIFILAFGLFICLFLFIFAPFGLAQIKLKSRFFISLGFGLVTIFVLIIFKYLLEPAVKKEKWTFGRDIIWGFLIASSIGVANYFYINIIFSQIFMFKYLIFSIWTAILVGIIPVSIGYMVFFNKIYRTALRDASISPNEILWEDEVIIRGGNLKNEYKFNPKSIVYLCSNDNYITVVTLKGDLLIKTHLRGTLKAAESELKKNNSFFRCHKCFIVNAAYADHVTGNIQNMKIRLKLHGLEIPVSRSKAVEVIKKIKKI